MNEMKGRLHRAGVKSPESVIINAAAPTDAEVENILRRKTEVLKNLFPLKNAFPGEHEK